LARCFDSKYFLLLVPVKINNAGGEEVASGTGVAILLKDEVDMQINPLKVGGAGLVNMSATSISTF